MRIKNSLSFMLAVILLTVFAATAQQEKPVSASEKRTGVSISPASEIEILSAQIVNVASGTGDESKEQLYLQINLPPGISKANLSGYTAVMTSYRKDGTFLGKSLWGFGQPCSDGRDVRLEIMNLEPGFDTAYKHTLEFKNTAQLKKDFNLSSERITEVTCSECNSMAISTCGRGRVLEFNCSDVGNGTCSFKCSPPPLSSHGKN